MGVAPELSAALPLRANWQPGARAKTADYTAEGEAILLCAMRDFEARIVGQDFFPNRTTRLQRVEKCFRDACATAKAQFISDKCVLKLVRQDINIIVRLTVVGYRLPLAVVGYVVKSTNGSERISYHATNLM